jgi:hypothetical protein
MIIVIILNINIFYNYFLIYDHCNNINLIYDHCNNINLIYDHCNNINLKLFLIILNYIL